VRLPSHGNGVVLKTKNNTHSPILLFHEASFCSLKVTHMTVIGPTDREGSNITLQSDSAVAWAYPKAAND
jgi:hypothetical protein